MEIRIVAKSVYGETKFYPANGPARCLANIAGTKTLTLGVLSEAAVMGCLIVIDGDATLAMMVPGMTGVMTASRNLNAIAVA